MQVTNSQQSFGGAKYSFNHHTNVPAITDRLKSEVDKVGQKYDVHSKLKGSIECLGGEHHCHDHIVKSKVVISKANKNPLEKVLHFFRLMPRATVTSTFKHNGDISSSWATAQGIGDVNKAVAKFESKA